MVSKAVRDNPGALTVSVTFFGVYRLITTQSEIEVTLPSGSTVQDLIDRLALQYGEGFLDHLIDRSSGKPWNLMGVALNGEILSDIQDFERPLRAGDEVLFLPPAMGG